MKPLKHSVKFDLQSGNKNGSSVPIRAWVSFNSERFPFNTGIRVDKKFWNKKEKKLVASAAFADYEKTSKDLKNVTTWVDQAFKHLTANNKYPTKESFKELCEYLMTTKGVFPNTQKAAIEDLITYAQGMIDRTKNGQRTKANGVPYAERTIISYNTTKNVISRYLEFRKIETLLFDNVDLDFYEDFREYLFKIEKKADNYFGSAIKNIKLFMAESKEDGLHSSVKFQSKRFKRVEVDVDNVYIDQEKLDKILKHDLSDKPRLDRVRDLFILGCYTGLRFSDFTNIKAEYICDGFIDIRRIQKTNDPVSIPIHPEVVKIQSKYAGVTSNSFPPAISNVKMNAYLKDLMKEVELNDVVTLHKTVAGRPVIIKKQLWELVTTHTCRRSFATNMFRMGIPTLIIMAITGHKTEKSFLKYIKVSPRDKAAMMAEIWSRQTMKIA